MENTVGTDERDFTDELDIAGGSFHCRTRTEEGTQDDFNPSWDEVFEPISKGMT